MSHFVNTLLAFLPFSTAIQQYRVNRVKKPPTRSHKTHVEGQIRFLSTCRHKCRHEGRIKYHSFHTIMQGMLENRTSEFPT